MLPANLQEHLTFAMAQGSGGLYASTLKAQLSFTNRTAVLTQDEQRMFFGAALQGSTKHPPLSRLPPDSMEYQLALALIAARLRAPNLVAAAPYMHALCFRTAVSVPWHHYCNFQTGAMPSVEALPALQGSYLSSLLAEDAVLPSEVPQDSLAEIPGDATDSTAPSPGLQ